MPHLGWFDTFYEDTIKLLSLPPILREEYLNLIKANFFTAISESLIGMPHLSTGMRQAMLTIYVSSP